MYVYECVFVCMCVYCVCLCVCVQSVCARARLYRGQLTQLQRVVGTTVIVSFNHNTRDLESLGDLACKNSNSYL